MFWFFLSFWLIVSLHLPSPGVAGGSWQKFSKPKFVAWISNNALIDAQLGEKEKAIRE
jgi:hypothetical protein